MTGYNRLLGEVIAASLLLFSCGLGNYAAYLSMLAALGVLLVPSNWPQLQVALKDWPVRAFLVAYMALATSLIVHAMQGGDGLIVLDFIPLALALPAVVALSHMDSERWPETLYTLAFAGALIAFLVVGYEHFVLGDARPRGVENSPIHYGILASTLGFLGLGQFLHRPSWRTSIFLIGPVLGIGAALLTGTRASVPTIAVLFVVAAVASVALFRIRMRHLLLFGVATVSIGIVVVAVLLALGTGAERAIIGIGRAFVAATSDPQADTSMAYRIEQYRAFVPAFLDSPIIGHGWHQQMQAAFPYLTDFGQRGFERQNWGYIHNEALSLTLGMGLFGTLGYLLIFSAPIMGIWQARRKPQFALRAYGTLIVLSGIWAGGLSDVLFMAELPKTFLIFLTLAFLVSGRQSAYGRNEHRG